MDLVALIFFPVFAFLVSGVFNLSFAPSTFLYFGLPALYLSWRRPVLIRKSLIFALVATIGFTFVLDHMVFLDRVWFESYSMYRIFGTITIEDAWWGINWTYFGVIFYEYFLDHDKNKQKISTYMRTFIIFCSLILIAFFVLLSVQSPLLHQEYFYLKGGLTLFALPVIFALFKMPKIIRKLLIVCIYFLFVSILHEYSALTLNHWEFLGSNYIGTSLLWGFKIPHEEFIFWWILGMPGLICWYELFADDRK